MDHKITVRPATTGWSVATEGFDNVMLFLSAERAEAAARGLARDLAKAGHSSVTEVWLRDGRLAGRIATEAVEQVREAS